MLLAPVAMHIPDGFLSGGVLLVLWIASVVVIGYALVRVREDMGERQVPMMAVMSAAIFAGQMLNFPVAGGTSGHLMGAALATILLGPWAAILVMTSVVGVQALLFQDGGLLALGGNIFNMAIVAVAVSYMVYRTAQKLAGARKWGVFAGGFAAAWLSIVLTSAAVALQLALSGTSPANLAIPAMVGIHTLIGIGEGLITLGALAFIYSTRRALLTHHASRVTNGGRWVWAGGLVMSFSLVLLAPYASQHPDGLEWVAEQQGFIGRQQPPQYSIIPDYLMPGIQSDALATIAAGFVGAVVVSGVALAVARSRRKRQAAP